MIEEGRSTQRALATNREARELLSKAKFEKVGEGEYRVLIPGSDITGIVSKAWARLGGWGWTYDGLPFSHSTRKEATRLMIKDRISKGIR